jgi:phenylalanyl-tRNA synthetase alpha chain
VVQRGSAGRPLIENGEPIYEGGRGDKWRGLPPWQKVQDWQVKDNDIGAMRQAALNAIAAAANASELDQVRRTYLGKNGAIKALQKSLPGLPVDERRAFGASVNDLQKSVTDEIEQRERDLLERSSVFAAPRDVTVPGLPLAAGNLHPTVQMMYDLNDAFRSLNFDLYSPPELSDEYFDFDCLNFPADHPARESMDTYWIAGTENRAGPDRRCLRPHLTGNSVRYMQDRKPPFRFVYPGRVYRNESTDARHERAFFQYEALIVDKNVPFSAGKLMVDTILEQVFGREVRTRMRAGFFPFVEPGFEIDMECLVCGGKGCRVCKNVGWLEVMPGGAPHPNVLRSAGIENPDDWMGFYINVGLDRLVMMRYAVTDVRVFHSADLRILREFK